MHDDSPHQTFRWNGRAVRLRAGDSLASALWRAGETVLARSRKLHRPLGWGGAHVAGALARVDGVPNMRLDQTPARPGMVVSMQNCWPSARFDLLRLMRFLPARLLYGGFEHGRLMPASGPGYRIAERVMAHLAGMSEAAPAGAPPAPVPGRDIAVDWLVVGGGPAGIAMANRHAAAGARVALVTRGAQPARLARAAGAVVPDLDPRVELFAATEVFGGYRDGDLVLAAAIDGEGPAIVFRPRQVVLATGRDSIPPIVRGNHLPGVLDARAALDLVAGHGVRLGRAVAVLGTGSEGALAARLRALGENVVHAGPVASLGRIDGRSRVWGIRVDGHALACDAVVHCGPWRADPGLPFQMTAEGNFQLVGAPLPGRVVLAGSAAQEPEPVPVPAQPHPGALICPCMDVTAGELLHHIDAGEHDPEVLKRLTSCGMGPCQGWPCWESMLALLAFRTGTRPGDHARPSHRPPRRAITVAQAAGLSGLVEPDR